MEKMIIGFMIISMLLFVFFFFPGRSFTELPKRNCEYFRTIFTYIVHTALLIPEWYVAVDWNDGHDVWMCRWWFFWPPAATVNSSKTHMNFNNSNRKKEREIFTVSRRGYDWPNYHERKCFIFVCHCAPLQWGSELFFCSTQLNNMNVAKK